MTGCLRIPKESIFTGLNNFEVLSILNVQYDECFGFTDTEVKKILSDYNLSDHYLQIRSGMMVIVSEIQISIAHGM